MGSLPAPMRFTVILALLAGLLPAADILTWDQGVAAMRSGGHPGYVVLIGRAGSLVARGVASGAIDTAGMPFIVLSANADVLNPYTERRVPGTRMILNLTGPTNDLTGGTLLFFDRDGILLPNFTAIQNFHRNRGEVVTLYCKMVASPLRDKLSIAEFAKLEGLPIGNTLVMEVESGKHKDFSWLFREHALDTPFVKGLRADGQPVDPLTDTAIHIITADPNGEVFVAQVREIWEKLSIPKGKNEFHRPPIQVFGPVNASYPALDALGIQYTRASLTKGQLATLATPIIVLPGGPEKKATILNGFLPGQVIGQYILPKETAGLISNHTLLHPDIAIGEHDVEPEASP